MSSESVIVTAIFDAAAGRLDDLRNALVEAIPSVHAEEGCELYAIHDAPNEQIVMIERWTNRGALDAHAAGAPVEALNMAIEGLIARPVTVTIMSAIPAGEPVKGTL